MTALEVCAGQLTHVQGSRHHGLSWRLTIVDALAAADANLPEAS